MLTRRGFILAGGSAVAALTLTGAAQAAVGALRNDALVVFSKARAPLSATLTQHQIVLTEDLTATLARFESMLQS